MESNMNDNSELWEQRSRQETPDGGKCGLKQIKITFSGGSAIPTKRTA
jgi:hypothetical protein